MLCKVIFGRNFNCSISLGKNINHLVLGENFKQQIFLSESIKYLNIDCNNYEIVDNMTNCIRYFDGHCSFRLPLNNVPNSLKKIKINNWGYKCTYKRGIDAQIRSKN